MKHKSLMLVTLAAVIAIALAGCGSDDSSNNSHAMMNSGSGDQTDAMFVTGMIPHHEAAVDMAELAANNATHPEIKTLANNIIKSQNAEIAQMKSMQSDLPETHKSMMSQDDMASMMSDVESLKGAKQFDKAFIDAMIPHHQAAVVMANQVIDNGSNAEVKKLAQAIVKAQSKEIAEMQSWRTEWYGKPLPSDQSSSMGSMHSMH